MSKDNRDLYRRLAIEDDLVNFRLELRALKKEGGSPYLISKVKEVIADFEERLEQLIDEEKKDE